MKVIRMITSVLVHSEDITSNTFDVFDDALTDEFWVEVEEYNELLKRDSDEPSVYETSPMFVGNPPSIR